MNSITRGCQLVALLLLCRAVAAQQSMTESMQEGIRARKMAMAFHVYAQENDGKIAPDMASLARYIVGDLSKATPAERAKAIRESLLSERDQGVKIPDKADEKWIGENSSFEYIGGGGVAMEDLGDWGNLAVLHLKLDRGMDGVPTPENPDGKIFSIAFLDSHVEVMGRAAAEQVIADSKAVFEAMRTGKGLPESQQIPMDLRLIIGAVRAYAKDHAGELPPDLGSTLPYIPNESKRLATLKQRAKVYLYPEKASRTHIPDEPSAEWVNENTSYTYLGGAGLKLNELEDPANCKLIHGKLDSPVTRQARSGPEHGIPMASASGGANIEDEEYGRWIIDISKKIIQSARTGSPLPDHVDAYRDTRLIAQAIAAFTEDHGGKLPGDLGELLKYVLPEAPRAERAGVFLSPQRLRNETLPDVLTAEWVVDRSSYIYLGGKGVDLKLVREAGAQILFHGPVSEAYTIRVPGGELPMVPSGTTSLYAWMLTIEQTERDAKETNEIVKAIQEASK